MKERKISRRAVCSAMVASLALGVLEGCGSSSFYYCFFCCRFRSSCFQRAYHCSHPEIQGRE